MKLLTTFLLATSLSTLAAADSLRGKQRNLEGIHEAIWQFTFNMAEDNFHPDSTTCGSLSFWHFFQKISDRRAQIYLKEHGLPADWELVEDDAVEAVGGERTLQQATGNFAYGFVFLSRGICSFCNDDDRDRRKLSGGSSEGPIKSLTDAVSSDLVDSINADCTGVELVSIAMELVE